MIVTFRFEKEQKVFDIAGIKIGGQPGEYPTVLVGSIFYEKHKIVTDPIKGIFDIRAAESMIKKQEELQDKTGNPFILDIVGTNSEALINYIDFVSDVTEAPFLIDGQSAQIRIPAIKHAIDIGLRDRAIYNSIEANASNGEISALRELDVRSAVLMAYDPKNIWVKGRLDILKGYEGQTGLLEFAKKAGIVNTLVDTAVFDVPSIGISSMAIKLVKSEYGLPAGCGTANAVTVWKRVRKEYGQCAYHACMAGAALISMMAGADFVLYGPVEFAEACYPVCAMADAIIAYSARQSKIRPKVKEHPLYKIF